MHQCAQTRTWIIVARSGFNLPTSPAKPAESGSGIPVRFGRKPVGTGQIQILKSKAAVQSVRTGLPVGWTGLPVGLIDLPAGLISLPVGLIGNRPNSIFLNSNACKLY